MRFHTEHTFQPSQCCLYKAGDTPPVFVTRYPLNSTTAPADVYNVLGAVAVFESGALEINTGGLSQDPTLRGLFNRSMVDAEVVLISQLDPQKLRTPAGGPVVKRYLRARTAGVSYDGSLALIDYTARRVLPLGYILQRSHPYAIPTTRSPRSRSPGPEHTPPNTGAVYWSTGVLDKVLRADALAEYNCFAEVVEAHKAMGSWEALRKVARVDLRGMDGMRGQDLWRTVRARTAHDPVALIMFERRARDILNLVTNHLSIKRETHDYLNYIGARV